MIPSSPDKAEQRETTRAGDGDALHIRVATPADIPAIAALIRKLAAHDGAIVPDATRLRAVLDALLQSDSTLYLIAEGPAGAIVGVLQLSFRLSTWGAAPYVYIEDFYVEEAFRGQGTGRALLERAVEIARDRGCVRMDLDVLSSSTAAQAFYTRHGFVDQKRLYLRRTL